MCLIPDIWKWQLDIKRLSLQNTTLKYIFVISTTKNLHWKCDFTDVDSAWVEVMAWSLMAPSHYLHQWLPKSSMPYDIPRPQWVHNLYGTTRLNSNYKHITLLWSYTSITVISFGEYNKNGIKCRNTLNCPDQHQCRGLRLRNSIGM